MDTGDATDDFGDLTDAAEGAEDAIEDANDAASGSGGSGGSEKRDVLGFDEITKLSNQSSGGSGGSSGSGGGTGTDASGSDPSVSQAAKANEALQQGAEQTKGSIDDLGISIELLTGKLKDAIDTIGLLLVPRSATITLKLKKGDSGASKATIYAAAICACIADLGFKSRGVKERPDLYVLKHTTAPAMLVECCFVDDADDVALYDADKMATAIVQGITGQAVTGGTPAQESAPVASTGTATATQGYPAQFQIWLNAGYSAGLTVDGLWGPKTRNAATAALQAELNAQFSKGLTVDGLWGPKTRAACVNVRQGARGNLTRMVQGVLYCRGLDPKGFDGIFGSGCSAAVKFFQEAFGLTADGIVGKNTWERLLG